MSKENHGFSSAVAEVVGVNCALIIQHVIFLQKSFAHGKQDFREVWVKRSVKTLRETYPYFSAKEIAGANERLERGGYLSSKIENDFNGDRTKSYRLTEKGLSLMGIPFDKKGNGLPERENGFDEKGNDILPFGEMNTKVYCSSFVPSFVEEKDASLFSSTSEKENQTIKAEKEKKALQNGAALQPPFTPTGETIEPQPARYVKLYDPQEPSLTIVEPAPPPEYQRDPRETPPAELRRVNIPEAVEAMRNDQTALEGFVIGRKLPRDRFAEYLSEFEAEQVGLKRKYKDETDLRLHFLNWSGVHHQIAQKRATQTNGKGNSHITRAGSDLSVYQEDQIF